MVATYRVPQQAWGRLTLGSGLNVNRTKITRNDAELGPLASIPDLVLFGRQESLRIERGQPRTKLNASAEYEKNWFGATLRATRYSKVLGAGSDPFGDVLLEAKVITDAELRFAPFGARATFALGANNLLDVYATSLPRGAGVDPVTGAARNHPSTNYLLPFSNFSPFGYNGRYLYARASFTF